MRSRSSLLVAVVFQACVFHAQSNKNSQAAQSAGGTSAASPGAPDASGGHTSGVSAVDPVAAGTGAGPYIGDVVTAATDVTTALPPLPALTRVNGTIFDDLVQVSFDPVAGAADYRIYPLPADGDIVNNANVITIHNATYRCAGNAETPIVHSDDGVNGDGSDQYIANGAVQTTRVITPVAGYTRTLAEATLGYVYTAAADGLVPVWGLGDPDYRADTTQQCQSGGWDASRVKAYTASQSEHDALVTKGWQDKGVLFYVPAAASAATVPVYTASDEATNASTYFTTVYFTSASELAARASLKPTLTNFVVLAKATDGAEPLMRVWYESACSGGHDELVVGATRFDQTYHQGNYPMTNLNWSGVTQPTTLVIEALSSGCPYQGMLAATHVDSATVSIINTQTPTRVSPAYVTMDEMRAASATGEVFINGQHDVSTTPQAIARSFVRVAPAPPPAMDFFDGFHDSTPFTFSAPVLAPPPFNFASYNMSNDKYEVNIYDVQDSPNGGSLFSAGTFLDQFWVTWADAGADTNGKFRLEPKQMATLASDTFLHGTLSIDSIATRRRYPQMIISDQPHPVQEQMINGHTVVVQQVLSWPPHLQIQYCDHKMWDVNAQCNYFELFHDDGGDKTNFPPVAHVGERSGADRPNQYDVYMSTERVYVYFDGTPYGCADLPAGKFQPGPASVSFGDVLYHSDVDVRDPTNSWIYLFHVAHLDYETRRHYDNVGFSSAVAEPKWDSTVIPCQTVLHDFETRAVVTP